MKKIVLNSFILSFIALSLNAVKNSSSSISEVTPWFKDEGPQLITRTLTRAEYGYTKPIETLLTNKYNKNLQSEPINAILEKIRKTTDKAKVKGLILQCLKSKTCNILEYGTKIKRYHSDTILPSWLIAHAIAVKLAKIMFPWNASGSSIDLTIEALKELPQENFSIKPWEGEFLTELQEQVKKQKRDRGKFKYSQLSTTDFYDQISQESTPIPYTKKQKTTSPHVLDLTQKPIAEFAKTDHIPQNWDNYEENVSQLTLFLLEQYRDSEKFDAQFVARIFQQLAHAIGLRKRLRVEKDVMKIPPLIFGELNYIFEKLQTTYDLDHYHIFQALFFEERLVINTDLIDLNMSDATELELAATIYKLALSNFPWKNPETDNFDRTNKPGCIDIDQGFSS